VPDADLADLDHPPSRFATPLTACARNLLVEFESLPAEPSNPASVHCPLWDAHTRTWDSRYGSIAPCRQEPSWRSDCIATDRVLPGVRGHGWRPHGEGALRGLPAGQRRRDIRLGTYGL